MPRAETQSRRESQNQDMGALPCEKPLYSLGFTSLSVLTGEAGNKHGFLCDSAPLREDNGFKASDPVLRTIFFKGQNIKRPVSPHEDAGL